MRLVAVTFMLWLAAGLVASAGTAVACGNGKLVYESQFKSEDPNWTPGDDSFKATVSPNGLTSSVPPGEDVSAMNHFGLYKNFEICAVFTIKGGQNASDFFALRFWTERGDNQYWAITWPEHGWFKVNYYPGNKLIRVTSQFEEPSLVNGNGTNEVSVSVSGDKGTFAVNGKKVTDFTGTPPERGSIFGFVMHADKDDPGPSTFTLKSIQLREVSLGH